MNEPSRLVIGYHASQASLGALGIAKDVGARMDAEIHIVHAIDLGDYPIDPDRSDWEEKAAETTEAQRSTVAAAMDGYPAHWQYHALRGQPFPVIRAVADRLHPVMIILGSRGDGIAHAAERLAGPSPLRRMTNHTNYPVLIVTTKGHPT